MQVRNREDSLLIDYIKECGQDIFRQPSINSSSLTFVLSQSDSINIIKNNDNDNKTLSDMLKPMVLPTDRTITKKTYGQKSDQKMKHIFSRQKYINNPIFDNSKNLETSRTSSKYKRYETDRSYESQHTARKIRKKIYEAYKEEQKIRQEKEQSKQKYSSSKKYSYIKSRFKEEEPLMKNLSGFIEKNVYGRLKTETQYLMKNPKIKREESQKKWDKFIKKQKNWQDEKINNQIKAKLKEELRIAEEMQIKKKSRKSPPKMTVDDYLGKLRRQTQKLKEKLNEYTFEPTIHESVTFRNPNPNRHPKYEPKNSRSKEKEKKRDKTSPQRKITVISNPAENLNFMFN